MSVPPTTERPTGIKQSQAYLFEKNKHNCSHRRFDATLKHTSVQDPSEIKNLRIFQIFMTRFLRDELVLDDISGFAVTSSGMLGGEFWKVEGFFFKFYLAY
jgi:hypothetical protein